jgi:hypothetical protein
VVTTDFEMIRAVVMSAPREDLLQRVPVLVNELCLFGNMSIYQFKQKTKYVLFANIFKMNFMFTFRAILKKLSAKCGKAEVLELIPILALKTHMLKEMRKEKNKKKKEGLSYYYSIFHSNLLQK